MAALGVVFGDLGTSPLYALREAFVGPHAIGPTPENVLGVLSMFIWALTIVVSVKYLAVMMRADNHGEGGIFALLALTGAMRAGAEPPNGRATAPRRRLVDRRLAVIVLLLGIAGAALLYGDGVITPAISVLSAVEGLGVATSAFQPYIVPLTAVVLFLLFLVQPLGSGRIGYAFGPVVGLWFVVIAAIGVRGIATDPSVLLAIDPRHAIWYFATNGWHGFPVLGAVVLCITGGEALYADMGHFGRRPIRIAWLAIAFPALLLNYLGQGAMILSLPGTVENPFFRSAPAWSLYPLVAIATAATIVASQAMITAVFSMTSQAVQLGLSPRVRVVHTSSSEIGQIYLPSLNWLLMIACLALVFQFQSSARLAAAYGLAVTGTMAITTMLFIVVARARWKWPVWRVAAVSGLFLAVDLTFLSSNTLKIAEGGWIPLFIGAIVFTVLSTWRRGRQLLTRAAVEVSGSADVEAVLTSIRKGSAVRVPGTAVYAHRDRRGVPRALLHNLKHNKVIHERVIFLTVIVEEVPFVPLERRVTITPLTEGFWRVVGRYGFMEQPHVPDLLGIADEMGLHFKPSETSYFVGRDNPIPSKEKPGMAFWREKLFAAMLRNASPITGYLGLTPDRVVELGAEVEI